MRLLWSPDAVHDLQRLRQFIEPANKSAAQRAMARIRQIAAALIAEPKIGRIVEDIPDMRELISHFGGGAYVLRYRIYSEVIVIARIWHSREQRY
jgi:plasmid stabilization system protein ParE